MTEKPSYAFDTGPVAMAFIVAAILFSSAFYFAPNKQQLIQQQNPQQHVLSVSADSSKEVAPDKVEITFSVYTNGSDPAAIQTENDAKMKKIASAVSALGVPSDNIETIGYSLDRLTIYNSTSEQYEDRGYQLTNTLRVVSYNVSQAGKIVAGAVQNGANEVSGISFSLSDATQKSVYNSLLEDASASAKDKANAMATAAGVKIVDLSSMSEGYNYVQPMANYNYMDMAAGVAKAPSAAVPEVAISSGLMKVSASVNAQYDVSG